MYLTSEEIQARVSEVIQNREGEQAPFEPEKQIRVCSIDLRVDDLFWRQRRIMKWGRGAPLDLAATRLYDIKPRRLWKKERVQRNGAIKLRPGEMLLGRTREKIRMPLDLVGKINTRGSYARLGLSTACNCDLVNPGYVGHVPLELTNSTRNTIVIHPLLPLCQLFLMPLTGEVSDSYESDRWSSKYIDDDGGPSVWWRDALVERIAERNVRAQTVDEVVRTILEKFPVTDDDVFDRLQRFVGSNEFDNAAELIHGFCKSERKSRLMYKISRWIIGLPLVMLVPAFLQFQSKFLNGGDPDIVSYIIWALFIIPIPFSFYNLSFGKEKVFFIDDD